MKKGVIHTLLYYGTCVIIVALLTLIFEQPAHFPGLNYLFIFLMIVAGFFLIIINIVKITDKKNRSYNVGALILNATFVITIVVTYLIGYYSQFA